MAKKRDVYTMSNGAPCTEGSVSEISNSLLAMPWLVPWAAKMVVCALAGDASEGFTHPLWQPGRAYSAKEIETALYEAKGAPRAKKETAGDVGTDWHALVGAYVEKQLMPENLPEGSNERRALQNFVTVTKDWEWLGSEITLVNEWLECDCPIRTALAPTEFADGECCSFCKKVYRRCGYGGTADGLARLPSGIIILPDFKTSNHVAATYSMQCLMYAEATPVGDSAHLAELWKQIKETRILHFNKDLLTWEVLERSLDEHRPYLQSFIGCARWNRRFNGRSYSTKDNKITMSATEVSIPSSMPTVIEQEPPATSIYIA